MRSNIKAGLLIIFLCFCVSASAQNTDASKESEEVECVYVEIDSTAFVLDISVWSNQGYLKDLEYQDFEIFVEGVKREIVFFSPPNTPPSFGKRNLSMERLKETYQYKIAVLLENVLLEKDKTTDIKVEIKLSEEKIKKYGEVKITLNNPE